MHYVDKNKDKFGIGNVYEIEKDNLFLIFKRVIKKLNKVNY